MAYKNIEEVEAAIVKAKQEIKEKAPEGTPDAIKDLGAQLFELGLIRGIVMGHLIPSALVLQLVLRITKNKETDETNTPV